MILLVLGTATALAPFLANQNLWTWVPDRVLIAAIPHIDPDVARLGPGYTREFESRSFSPAEYNQIIRKASLVYDRPAHSERRGMLRYRLGFLREDAKGRIAFGPVSRLDDFESRTAHLYRILDADTARALARSLLTWWRDERGRDAISPRMELRTLVEANSSAAMLCLERLFEESIAWPPCALDPRAADGEAMRVLLQEYHQNDPVRRARAAAVLAEFFFEITTHWRRPEPGLV